VRSEVFINATNVALSRSNDDPWTGQLAAAKPGVSRKAANASTQKYWLDRSEAGKA
jgi:hypothetical protein